MEVPPSIRIRILGSAQRYEGNSKQTQDRQEQENSLEAMARRLLEVIPAIVDIETQSQDIPKALRCRVYSVRLLLKVS